MSFYSEFLAAFVTIVIALIWYYIKNWQNVCKKLRWVKSPPQIPFLGHVLYFKDAEDILKVLSKYTTEYDGIVFLNAAFKAYVVVSDYKLIQFVLSSNKIIKKSPDYKFFHQWLGTGLLTSEGAKWKQRRRIITPAFHFSILEQYIDVFDQAGGKLVKKLESEVDKESVDIYPYVTLCALDIICESAMGVSVNAQDHEDSDYVKSVEEIMRILRERMFSIIEMHDISYPLTRNYYKEKRVVKLLHDYTTSIIETRRRETKNKTVTKDTDEFGVRKKMAFLDLLLQATVNGQPLSNEDIREEVDTFVFEGHDTTASAMSFALFLIAGDQDVQSQIISEQQEIFGSDKDRVTTHRDLHQMTYLDRVIKEAIRLYPSVPTYSREAEEDIEFEEGKIIPKGSTIMIYAFGANRSPKYFEDPDLFNPSRFEINDGKNPFAYIPFSAGPRNCIGQKFAMLEMKCTISKILRHYELHPSIPEHIPILQGDAVLKSKNGIKIMLKKRNWI